jgi:hypothetical protein
VGDTLGLAVMVGLSVGVSPTLDVGLLYPLAGTGS